MQLLLGDCHIQKYMMPYSDFVPRFYNLCISYGFEPGRIMPSQAFCSDENQGLPIILITKHFGTFPFNHGHIGGVVATDRHAPHAHHGKDLVLIQASHVGYDPESSHFGSYRRLQHVDDTALSHSCGKICGILDWYIKEYAFAAENITFSRPDTNRTDTDEALVFIDNQFLDPWREEGLFIHFERLVAMEANGAMIPRKILSTSKAFRVHPEFRSRMPESLLKTDRATPIGDELIPELFYFKRNIQKATEGSDHLEWNLTPNMPQIVTSAFPALTAAVVNTQVEFDRTYRTIIKQQEYAGKNLAFISGINIDVLPLDGTLFPLTHFVPWAAFIQTQDGRQILLEQQELSDSLHAQAAVNHEQIDLEDAIRVMADISCRVLLVDDEREFVETLCERLKIRHVNSEIAYDGESALKIVQKENPPQVMILDLKMPGIDGIETLRRTKDINPNIEIVMLTGHGNEDDKNTCMAAGAFAYLQKPVNIDELWEILNNAFEKQRN